MKMSIMFQYLVIVVFFRYELMQSCWNPASRPSFSTIVDYLGRVQQDIRVGGTDGNINPAYTEDEKPPGYNTAVRLREGGRGSRYNPGRISAFDESTAL